MPAGTGGAILAGTVLLAAAWLAFRLASGFDGLYGQDAYEYLRFAGEVRAFLVGGAAPGPFFWPVVYPACAAGLSLLTGSTVSAAQLVSALALLGAFAAGAAALARRSPADARLAVVFWGVAFALAPYLVRASLASMSDLLAAAFLCAFLLFAFEWERSERPLDLAMASFFAVAAVTTRHPVGLVLAPAAAVLAVRALRKRNLAVAGLAVASALLALAPTLLLARGGASSPLHYPGLTAWSLSNAFSRTIDSPDGRETYKVPTALFALSNAASPGFFVLGLPLLLAVRKEDFAQPLSARAGRGLAPLDGLPRRGPLPPRPPPPRLVSPRPVPPLPRVRPGHPVPPRVAPAPGSGPGGRAPRLAPARPCGAGVPRDVRGQSARARGRGRASGDAGARSSTRSP